MVVFYCFIMEQHGFYLLRFFVIDFSQTLNPLFAFVINTVTCGTLCRNLYLYYTCSTMDVSLNAFKNTDQSHLKKKRAEDTNTFFEQGYFTPMDVITINGFESDYQPY